MSMIGSSSSLTDRVAVVTGAGSGIGEATAKRLSTQGAHVIVADINPKASHRVVQEIAECGGDALNVTLDVSSESSWNNLQAIVEKQWQRWDILINSAGISFAKPIRDMTLTEWRRVHAVNLDGIFLGMRAALRMMHDQDQSGVIINIASLSGMVPFPAASAYSSSKAAVLQLSRVAARECLEAGHDIRVYTIVPGGVKTPMWKTMTFFRELAKDGEEAAWNSLDPENHFLEPEDIANAVLELVVHPYTHPNGQTWILDQKGSRGRMMSLSEPSPQ